MMLSVYIALGIAGGFGIVGSFIETKNAIDRRRWAKKWPWK